MALVTVQRSPNSPGPSTDESDSLDTQEGDEENTDKKGISECYFAVKGAALVLPHDECIHVHRKNIANGACDIQQHLQSMLYLLHADDILKMAVKLESVHGSRNRYLVVVYHGGGMNQTDESCLLGVDCNRETTIGLLLPVWADTKITLDGDGGFSVTSSGRHHIFKPVSVQAMWSALQTLHKASSKAREYNYFKCGGTHHWVEYYENRISSDRSCLNEWHAMDDIESKRPPSPDTVRVQPTEREATERHIRTKLKELMMSVDLDEVTSKYIRTRLEDILDSNLQEYKSFIDQEMLTILGQMDAPAEIFNYLYLGSEWNASNLEELVVNGIGHILNVTREIDNFFPGMFDYQNIRVYDDESTEILHYWDKTYRYIRRAKDEGSKVLVHCKMGISRSASVVIAYVMKAYDWDLQRALDFVKTKRGCIKPNSGFLKQLEIYQGILDASKQRHNSLWRSKSETNLKSATKPKKKEEEEGCKKRKVPEKSESLHHLTANYGASLRPKSWSPSEAVADMLFPSRHSTRIYGTETTSSNGDHEQNTFSSLNLETNFLNLIPQYSDIHSQDTDCHRSTLPRVSSIKDRINELELQVGDKPAPKAEVKSPTSQSRSGLVFNLANQFESGSKPSSPVDDGLVMRMSMEEAIVVSQTKPPVCKHHAVLVKPSLWPETEPGEGGVKTITAIDACDNSRASHSAFKPLNPHSRGPLDQKLGQFLGQNSCQTSSERKVNLNLERNCNLSGNKELGISSKCQFMQNSCQLLGSSERKAIGNLNLEKNSNLSENKDSAKAAGNLALERNSLVNKESISNEIEKILEPISPIKSSFKYHDNILDRKAVINPNPPNKKESITPSNDIQKILEPMSPIKSPFKLQDCALDGTNEIITTPKATNPNYFYDKEDIPFTPGRVQRTKQEIEEKNLTRTMSFDSGFPVRTHSTPSTPPEGNLTPVKIIRRSHSLRNDCGKWYPLPALATHAPRRGSQCLMSRRSASLSVSTPSVVEAVNRVICGTQEVLSSAIPFLPSKKASSGSSDSDFDFGSANSLPDMDTLESPPPLRESPVPGLVKLQREILENRGTGKQLPVDSRILENRGVGKQLVVDSRMLENRSAGKQLTVDSRMLENRGKQESSQSDAVPLVISEAGPKCEDLKESGIVKRLKMELEAKSTGAGLPDSSPEEVQRIQEDHNAKRAPPAPHRKASLDLSFVQRKLRLGQSAPVIKPSRPGFGLPDPCIAEIPPMGLTRKLRKQQGSSHPLSKLIKQRHPNPLYNTM